MKIINPASYGRVELNEWRTYPDIYTQSLWPEKLPSKPADYGSNNFHGRTHPDIIKVALTRYTQPGDVVWDCMAGGGTTLDVCAELGNPCTANDVNPQRADIIKADSRYWRPAFDVDLVVCHPPYMHIIDYMDDGLSTPDLTKFKLGMGQVLDNVHKALKVHRMLVLIIGTLWHDRRLICLDYELMELLDKFRLIGRIVRPFGETKGGATSGKKNENLWKYRRLRFGLWDLNQDIVLFLQKLPH